MHFYPVIFAAALLSTVAIGEAQADDASNCLIMIEGKIYLEGDCSLSHDGRRLEIEARNTSANRYRASIERNADQSATARWNGPQAQSDTNIEIGQLKPNGPTCWMNNRTMLCLSPVGFPSAAAYDDAAIAEMEEEIAGDQEDSGMNQGGNGTDFGSAFAETANAGSITCLFADEDLLPPDRRTMARGMGGRSYTGHVTRLREFVFDGDQRVTFAGTPFTIIWKEGAKVAIPAMAKPSASSLIPGMPEDELAELQQGLDKMRELQGAASGLDQRVIILDFDAHQAVVATLTGDALTERQPLRCE